MATAKKLPSGSWRVRVYSHTENDRQIYESFTAPTKKEAELKAAEWQNKRDRHRSSDLTVYEAIEGYISAKEGVLSPSTIRGYVRMFRNNYSLIQDKYIRKLTTEDLQIFVSDLSRQLSPKSVRNVYGLLSSALALYMPDTVFRVTLPKKIKKRLISPSDEDIQTLFEAASPELKKCIALSAFGSIRRGELCALTFSDIEGDTIHIHRDMVQNKKNSWETKEMPKTAESVRDASYPHEIIELLGKGENNEKIIKYKNPGSITQCFTKLRDRLDINIRFHDLRHYFASIGAVLGIPDNYLSDFGGWKRGSSVMKEVYQNNIVSMSEVYSEKMKRHFKKLI